MAGASDEQARGNSSGDDLRTVILLAGRVGPNAFADAVGRSVLDLPVTDGVTLLDLWMDGLAELADELGAPKLRVCLSVDQNGPAPTLRTPARHPGVEIEIRRDPAEYRGTAGVVRDLTRDFAPGERVLVAAANQLQREPLPGLVRALAAHEESVSIVPHLGSELAGVFLLRCDRLRNVSDVGFVDLKEQAIPASQGRSPLYVVPRPAGSMLPVRTLEEYIHALRVRHLEPAYRADSAARESPYAETWEPAFRIVEEGAQVASGAVLQDTVVLAGGRVEAGATLARSVVCSRGLVRQGRVVVEQIVTG